MSAHIVLLRGINLGKHNRIAMAELRALLGELGFTGVATLLASGNAVVTAAGDDPAEVATTIRAGIAERFGLDVPTVVRSRAQIERVIARNPMPAEAASAPKYFHVGFRDPLPEPGTFDVVDAESIRPERLVVDEGTLYLWFTEGPVRTSPLVRALARTKLDDGVTMRNWNTVRKLVDLAEA